MKRWKLFLLLILLFTILILPSVRAIINTEDLLPKSFSFSLDFNSFRKTSRILNFLENETEYSPSLLFIKFKPGYPNPIEKLRERFDVGIKYNYSLIDWVVINFSKPQDLNKIIPEIESLEFVQRVEKVSKVRALGYPADSLRYEINRLGYNGSGIKIAILDTGIDSTHPDLVGAVTKNVDFVGDGPGDGYGHGTHCAGIAAGRGRSNKAFVGVAPSAEIFDVKVLSNEGWGEVSDIIAGIEWAVENGANIISMSLGGWGSPTDPLAEAITRAVERGTVVVVAAGNDGPDFLTTGFTSPACAEKAITVGSSYENKVTWYSSRGPVYNYQTINDTALNSTFLNSTILGSSMNHSLKLLGIVRTVNSTLVINYKNCSNWVLSWAFIGKSLFSFPSLSFTYNISTLREHTDFNEETFIIPGDLLVSNEVLLVFDSNSSQSDCFVSYSLLNYTADQMIMANYIKPDLVAPGGDFLYTHEALVNNKIFENGIISTKARNSLVSIYLSPYEVEKHYIKMSGTSMAAPYVAGAAALLLQKNPNLTPDEVKALLVETSSDLGFIPSIQGGGNINVTAALLSDFLVLPSSLNFLLKAGDEVSRYITIKNLENKKINITLKISDALTSFINFARPDGTTSTEVNFILQPHSAVEINLTIKIPINWRDTYAYGAIEASSGASKLKVPVEIYTILNVNKKTTIRGSLEAEFEYLGSKGSAYRPIFINFSNPKFSTLEIKLNWTSRENDLSFSLLGIKDRRIIGLGGSNEAQPYYYPVEHFKIDTVDRSPLAEMYILLMHVNNIQVSPETFSFHIDVSNITTRIIHFGSNDLYTRREKLVYRSRDLESLLPNKSYVFSFEVVYPHLSFEGNPNNFRPINVSFHADEGIKDWVSFDPITITLNRTFEFFKTTYQNVSLNSSEFDNSVGISVINYTIVFSSPPIEKNGTLIIVYLNGSGWNVSIDNQFIATLPTHNTTSTESFEIDKSLISGKSSVTIQFTGNNSVGFLYINAIGFNYSTIVEGWRKEVKVNLTIPENINVSEIYGEIVINSSDNSSTMIEVFSSIAKRLDISKPSIFEGKGTGHFTYSFRPYYYVFSVPENVSRIFAQLEWEFGNLTIFTPFFNNLFFIGIGNTSDKKCRAIDILGSATGFGKESVRFQNPASGEYCMMVLQWLPILYHPAEFKGKLYVSKVRVLPEIGTIEMNSGENKTFTLNISNIGAFENITLTSSGEIANWISYAKGDTNIANLSIPLGGWELINVTISIPSNVTAGTYTGELLIENWHIPVIVYVSQPIEVIDKSISLITKIGSGEWAIWKINISKPIDKLIVELSWMNPFNDIDLFLYNPKGELAAKSASVTNTSERVIIDHPELGVWTAAAYGSRLTEKIDLNFAVQFVKSAPVIMPTSSVAVSSPIVVSSQPTPPTTPPTYSFEIVSPSQIEVFTNETIRFKVEVRNNGTGTITNIRLGIGGLNNSYEVEPSCLVTLKPNASAFFDVKISPLKADEYTLVLSLTSDQFKEKRELLLKVKELPEKTSAERLIEEVETSIEAIKEKGLEYNLTDAYKFLAEAKEAFAREDYVKAKEFAQKAIEAIRTATPLAKKTSQPILIFVVTAVSVVLIGIILTLRRFAARKSEEKFLLEKMETIRTQLEKLAEKGIDVNECLRELELAKQAYQANLKDIAEVHLENVRKLLGKVESVNISYSKPL